MVLFCLFVENIEITSQAVNDIHDWGVEKIKNEKNFSQRAITNLDVILNETAETNVADNPQYTSFNETEETGEEMWVEVLDWYFCLILFRRPIILIMIFVINYAKWCLKKE